MSRTTRRIVLCTLAGFGYGALLVLVGACADYRGDKPLWGHTSPLLIGLCAAPLAPFPQQSLVWGALSFWSLIGLLVGLAERAAARYALWGILAVHYVCAVLFLAVGLVKFQSWAVDGIPPDVGAAVLGTYMAGQVVLWRLLRRRTTPSLRADVTSGGDAVRDRGTGQPMRFAAVGLIYGVLLLLFASLAVRHWDCEPQLKQGVVTLVCLASAPLGLFPGGVSFYGAPFLWALVGWLVGMSRHFGARLAVWIIMAVHYAAAMFLLPNRAFGDWCYYQKDWYYVERLWGISRGTVVVGLALYALGQLLLWYTLDHQRVQVEGKGAGRHRLQFSLKSLLLATFGLSVLLAWGTTEYRRSRRNKAAIAEIQFITGKVGRLEPALVTEFRRYFQTRIDDDLADIDQQRRYLRGVNEFTMVRLWRSDITDAGLADLKDVPNLYALCIAYADVTDAGLAHLHQLPALRYLRIAKTDVTGEGLEELQRASPQIEINATLPSWAWEVSHGPGAED